jgi:hypothetical protein
MAKSTLTERFVQNTVAEQLNKEYYGRRPAYVVTEAYTKLKRADVFIAFMRARKRPYVVVVEAKSRTTIHQLKLKDDKEKILWTGRIITILLIAGLSATLGYQWYFNALNTVLLLGLFLLGAGAISTVIVWLELSALKSVGAIEQLGRYPANEHWIAIGEDTFVQPAEYRAMRRQCRKNSIGLIVVTARGRLLLKEIPTPRHTFNNYLDNYGKQGEILKVIDKNPSYGSTPPERRKMRRQLLNAAVMVGLVSIMGAIAYEENVAQVIPDPFTEGAWDIGPPDTLQLETIPAIDSLSACDQFSVSQRSFIIVDGLLDEDKAAMRLAKLLNAGLLEARSAPTECLNSWPAPGRFAVWTGVIFPDRPSASAAAETYRQRLEAAGMEPGYGKVVKVRPGR